MIIPDVKLLIYAYDSSAPSHGPAAKWWTGLMSGPEEVGLPTVVIFGFVRLCTHPRVFVNPLTIAEATERVESWLSLPQVRVVDPSPRHVFEVLRLLGGTGAGANLTTDAQIGLWQSKRRRSSTATTRTSFDFPIYGF